MDIVNMLGYLLPMLFLSGVFYLLIDKFFKEEHALRHPEHRDNERVLLLQQRLQSYERIALFLERIKPNQLLERVDMVENVKEFQYLLVQTITQEFSHNLSQQIYLNPETWSMVMKAKNSIQQHIFDLGENEINIHTFRKKLLQSPTPNETIAKTLLRLQMDVSSLG